MCHGSSPPAALIRHLQLLKGRIFPAACGRGILDSERGIASHFSPILENGKQAVRNWRETFTSITLQDLLYKAHLGSAAGLLSMLSSQSIPAHTASLLSS